MLFRWVRVRINDALKLETCTNSNVADAVSCVNVKSFCFMPVTGYRLLDTALLYANQVEVGQGLRNSLNAHPDLKREDIWVTSKVAFFPPESTDVWMFNANNIKGNEEESINLSLKQLQLDYVDLLLIHNPIAGRDEYRAACIPHFFEFFKLRDPENAIRPDTLPDGEKIRSVVATVIFLWHTENPILHNLKRTCIHLRCQSVPYT